MYNNMYNTSGNITYNKPIIYNTTTNVGYVPISKLDSDYSTRIYGPINDDEGYILAIIGVLAVPFIAGVIIVLGTLLAAVPLAIVEKLVGEQNGVEETNK